MKFKELACICHSMSAHLLDTTRLIGYLRMFPLHDIALAMASHRNLSCICAGSSGTGSKCQRIKIAYFIMKTRLFKYIEINFTRKKKTVSYKNSDIFHISAQNIVGTR